MRCMVLAWWRWRAASAPIARYFEHNPNGFAAIAADVAGAPK